MRKSNQKKQHENKEKSGLKNRKENNEGEIKQMNEVEKEIKRWENKKGNKEKEKERVNEV